jgi:hypothetical protein
MTAGSWPNRTRNFLACPGLGFSAASMILFNPGT